MIAGTNPSLRPGCLPLIRAQQKQPFRLLERFINQGCFRQLMNSSRGGFRFQYFKPAVVSTGDAVQTTYNAWNQNVCVIVERPNNGRQQQSGDLVKFK